VHSGDPEKRLPGEEKEGKGDEVNLKKNKKGSTEPSLHTVPTSSRTIHRGKEQSVQSKKVQSSDPLYQKGKEKPAPRSIVKGKNGNKKKLMQILSKT